MTIDRTPKPCHHPVADHQHGTYAAYTLDACRCLPCAFACFEYRNDLTAELGITPDAARVWRRRRGLPINRRYQRRSA